MHGFLDILVLIAWLIYMNTLEYKHAFLVSFSISCFYLLIVTSILTFLYIRDKGYVFTKTSTVHKIISHNIGSCNLRISPCLGFCCRCLDSIGLLTIYNFCILCYYNNFVRHSHNMEEKRVII